VLEPSVAGVWHAKPPQRDDIYLQIPKANICLVFDRSMELVGKKRRPLSRCIEMAIAALNILWI